jgi:hypothetical protein
VINEGDTCDVGEALLLRWLLKIPYSYANFSLAGGPILGVLSDLPPTPSLPVDAADHEYICTKGYAPNLQDLSAITVVRKLYPTALGFCWIHYM